MDLISKEELKDYLEKNISFGGTEKKFRFYDMIDSLPSAFEGMTNGEVFLQTYPEAQIKRNGNIIEVASHDFSLMATSEWWNTPYQKGGEGDK